ncbi:MAG: alcohol dehydrogenase [Planctomycetota bacterium]|nr:MAG: alcohol dehydrogenase [Planctomycetota bacterium]
MRAMVLERQAPAASRPLGWQELEDPRPADDEVLVRLGACGVCRTDLHLVEGDLPPHRLPVVPGHQAVGRVEAVGAAVRRFRPGDRVGVAWVHRLCLGCEPCIEGRENLCEHPTFTGWDVDGGYAEKIVVPAAFAHPLPAGLGDDAHVAPLLCAGIIGYRALKRSGLRPGSRIGLWGFGASAHLALQIARAWGAEVFVVTRSEAAQQRARRLGAAWAGGPGERPPRPLAHAISFAPAGSVLPEALAALDRGGTLAIAGIHLDRVPELDYEEHLFYEKSICSVTANTRRDARELLALAARLRLETDIETFPLEQANEALARLAADQLGAQAAVLTIG